MNIHYNIWTCNLIYATAKIHYDLTQVVVVNFIVTTLFWYNTTYSVKCYFVWNSNYFYFIINCGSKMVHYCTNSRNSVAKPSSFPARPLGMLYLVLPADCWYNFIFYNPNKLHCKLLDTKKFSCSICCVTNIFRSCH